MESYMDVTYEVIDPITRESFFTKDNYVATHHYEKGWMVYENHTTISQPSLLTQTQLRVIVRWHGKPQI